MKTLIFGAGPLASLYADLLRLNAARDEMIELGIELKTLANQTSIKTPNLDELIDCIS